MDIELIILMISLFVGIAGFSFKSWAGWMSRHTVNQDKNIEELRTQNAEIRKTLEIQQKLLEHQQAVLEKLMDQVETKDDIEDKLKVFKVELEHDIDQHESKNTKSVDKLVHDVDILLKDVYKEHIANKEN